jgi:transposase
MVAKPRAIAHFALAYLRRSKTDAMDAHVIVEFAMRMPFSAWKLVEAYALDLRAPSPDASTQQN